MLPLSKWALNNLGAGKSKFRFSERENLASQYIPFLQSSYLQWLSEREPRGFLLYRWAQNLAGKVQRIALFPKGGLPKSFITSREILVLKMPESFGHILF